MLILRKYDKESLSQGYKVYKDRQNYIIVDAKTASDAIIQSGIERPFKLVKIGSVRKTLVASNELIDPNNQNNSSAKPEYKDQSPDMDINKSENVDSAQNSQPTKTNQEQEPQKNEESVDISA